MIVKPAATILLFAMAATAHAREFSSIPGQMLCADMQSTGEYLRRGSQRETAAALGCYPLPPGSRLLELQPGAPAPMPVQVFPAGGQPPFSGYLPAQPIAPAPARQTAPPKAIPLPAPPKPVASPDPPAPALQSEADAGPVEHYQTVDIGELGIGSRKYMHRNIELRRMHCYYADVGDYRCSKPGFSIVSVFASKIEPSSAADYVEEHCDTVKKTFTTPACVVTVRFEYGPEDVKKDFVDLQERTIIALGAISVLVPKK